MDKKYIDFFKGKRVLITGGAGFIGSNLAIKLVDCGAEVTLVDSLIPEYGGNLFNLEPVRDKVELNISDVRDRYGMKYLVQGKDILFNLAGQTSHMDSMQNPLTDLDINARSQLEVLESCRENNPGIKIIFASTRQIYGKPQYLPVDESHRLDPVDINGVNKLAGEGYHMVYNKVYGLDTCILRLTNTIGPRMRIKDARQTFLGVWIKLLLEGKPFEVWGGDQLRDFTDVDDAVEAMMLAAVSQASNGKAFNLGGDGVISLKDLADLLVVVNGSGEFEIKEFPSDRKKIDIEDYYAKYDLIRDTLGWNPRILLKESLMKALSFYKENIKKYV